MFYYVAKQITRSNLLTTHLLLCSSEHMHITMHACLLTLIISLLKFIMNFASLVLMIYTVPKNLFCDQYISTLGSWLVPIRMCRSKYPWFPEEKCQTNPRHGDLFSQIPVQCTCWFHWKLSQRNTLIPSKRSSSKYCHSASNRDLDRFPLRTVRSTQDAIRWTKNRDPLNRWSD